LAVGQVLTIKLDEPNEKFAARALKMCHSVAIITVKWSLLRTLAREKREFNLVQQVVCYYPCSRPASQCPWRLADGGDL